MKVSVKFAERDRCDVLLDDRRVGYLMLQRPDRVKFLKRSIKVPLEIAEQIDVEQQAVEAAKPIVDAWNQAINLAATFRRIPASRVVAVVGAHNLTGLVLDILEGKPSERPGTQT